MYFMNQYTVHIVLYILYASILQIYFDKFFKENYALVIKISLWIITFSFYTFTILSNLSMVYLYSKTRL